MTENNTQTMLFKEYFGKKVIVDFNGGEITSDAGLLFLRETEAQIKIIERAAAAIFDKRNPAYVRHQISQLLTQRVFQIAAGYEDANDCDTLKNDPILKMACGQEDSLASQSTMCRFENAPDRKTLYRLSEVLVDGFICSYDKAPESIILDLDDTADPTYGDQQLSLFNAHYDCHCYQPLHIYEGKSGKLLAAILRPGKRPSGKEVVSILKRIIRKIRQAWPEVGIIIRGDAHFSSPAVYDFCEAHHLKYVLGFKAYKPLQELAQNLMNKARELYQETSRPVKIYGQYAYQAESWPEAKRVICKAEYNDKGANTRFIITNLKHSTYRFIYETVYCGRGAMELMIKEHKNHLASDRTSCSSFSANQFRLLLHSIAYHLMHAFRERHLRHTEFARAQFNTIRLRFFKIGARVRNMASRIKIHLPMAYPLKADFEQIWQSCCVAGYS
jgi:hypothetical protein